jgi:hypothetical protein
MVLRLQPLRFGLPIAPAEPMSNSQQPEHLIPLFWRCCVPGSAPDPSLSRLQDDTGQVHKNGGI